MSPAQKSFLQVVVALIVPVILGAVAYGVMTQRVSQNERAIQSNEQANVSNGKRINELESKSSQYETDVRWIKQTLLEIKQELRK